MAEPGQPEGAADLDDLAVDRHDRAHDAEIDREEHADRDQGDLRGLEDAEPENEQRHPGDRGNGAQRLQGRIDQPAHQRRIAGDRAEQRCRRRRRSRSPATTREQRRAGMALQVRRCGRARRRSCTMTDGGGTRRPLDKAKPYREFPGHRQRDRQQQVRARAATARQASAARNAARSVAPVCTSAGSTLAVIDTRDITGSRNATARRSLTGAGRARAPRNAGLQRQFVSAHASGRRSGHRPSSSRRRRP